MMRLVAKTRALERKEMGCKDQEERYKKKHEREREGVNEVRWVVWRGQERGRMMQPLEVALWRSSVRRKRGTRMRAADRRGQAG